MLPEISKKLKERGDGCYDLIVKMLNPNPRERPTAVEVLQHEFFVGIKKKKKIESPQISPAAVYDVSVSFAQLSSSNTNNLSKVIRLLNAAVCYVQFNLTSYNRCSLLFI